MTTTVPTRTHNELDTFALLRRLVELLLTGASVLARSPRRPPAYILYLGAMVALFTALAVGMLVGAAAVRR